MPTEQELLEEIKQVIIDGDEDDAPKLVQEGLDEGVSALTILNDGLIAGTNEVGQRFETGEFFLPELMLTGRALKAAMVVLTPVLQAQHAAETTDKETGVVVMATVQTDIHDIGKNMVASMLTASGFEVIDLGVDVPIKTIIAKAVEANANIIGCSALLTTSMPYIRDLLDLLEVMGKRQRFKVMVGGASVTADWAAQIGADGTARNPIGAVNLAKQLIREQAERQEATD
ncbi:MAG TPA: corrinoid protein [Anaerolineae bacterium]|nr:corrinoid protein [Anaerolineae bacterium]